MAYVIPYLQFGGKCREAMEFYKECIGGELDLQPLAGSPMAEGMPAEAQGGILHGSLIRDTFFLYGSDMAGPDVKQGTSVVLCFTSPDLEELKTVFAKLAEGGTITHDLAVMPFGTYGDLTDKYGFGWMFQSDNK